MELAQKLRGLVLLYLSQGHDSRLKGTVKQVRILVSRNFGCFILLSLT